MKFRNLIKLLEDDGWVFDHQRGSHKVYTHPTKPGIVVVAAGGKMADEVPPGTLNSILKQAGLK